MRAAVLALDGWSKLDRDRGAGGGGVDVAEMREIADDVVCAPPAVLRSGAVVRDVRSNHRRGDARSAEPRGSSRVGAGMARAQNSAQCPIAHRSQNRRRIMEGLPPKIPPQANSTVFPTILDQRAVRDTRG